VSIPRLTTLRNKLCLSKNKQIKKMIPVINDTESGPKLSGYVGVIDG
jgi:hypothetical protein